MANSLKGRLTLALMCPVNSKAPMVIITEPAMNITNAIRICLTGTGGSLLLNYLYKRILKAE